LEARDVPTMMDYIPLYSIELNSACLQQHIEWRSHYKSI
jgi:hypothetical protein